MGARNVVVVPSVPVVPPLESAILTEAGDNILLEDETTLIEE
jgi:hypothetical protein